jgi:SH3 domain-containing YSC84-like protein 1
MRITLLSCCLAGALATAPLMADDHDKVSDHDKRFKESATVLSEIMGAGDQGIPQDLLENAHCIGIVPNLKRAGFIIGGQYGKGVLTCRSATGWTAPSTIRVEGGSIGLQIGAGETDVVLLVMNERGKQKLLQDKFTVGADASVMAGPVGRSAKAATDAQMHAEILSYSRSRGVFAGVSLEGSTLRPDTDDNEKVYGRKIAQSEILSGKVQAPAVARPLLSELTKYSPHEKP